MKVKSVTIVHFKGIDYYEYIPKNPTACMLGNNGRGKTSFKQAVYAGLTGNFPDNCIAEDSDMCSVSITLEDDTEITRIMYRDKPNETRVNGRKVTKKSADELLCSRTTLDNDIFKIVTSSERLEALTSAELGELMLAAIPEKLNIDKILKYAGTITPEVKKVIEDFFPIMPEEFEMSKITEFYDACFEQRKYYKKLAAGYKSKVDTFFDEEPEEKAEDLQKRLEEIIAEEAKYSEAKKVAAAYESAIKARQKAEENIKSLEAQIAEISATRPIASAEASIKSEIKNLREELVNAKAFLETLRNNIASFKNTVSRLSENKCPLSSSLVCTTDKSALKDELEELIKSNEDGVTYQETRISKLEKDLESAETKLSEYNKNAAAYDKKIILTQQLETAKLNLPKVPEETVTTAPENFEAEKAHIRGLQKAAERWNMHLKDIESYENFKNLSDVYDAACKLFDKKGAVVSSIMDYYLEIFEDTFNARAAEIRPGIAIKFTAIDGVSYRIATDVGGPFKAFDALSSGEKCVVSFLLCDMFNVLSQQRIMFIDDIDKLDSNIFSQLMSVVMSPAIQSSYDHIFLMGVAHKDIVDVVDTIKNIDLI